MHFLASVTISARSSEIFLPVVDTRCLVACCMSRTCYRFTHRNLFQITNLGRWCPQRSTRQEANYFSLYYHDGYRLTANSQFLFRFANYYHKPSLAADFVRFFVRSDTELGLLISFVLSLWSEMTGPILVEEPVRLVLRNL